MNRQKIIAVIVLALSGVGFSSLLSVSSQTTSSVKMHQNTEDIESNSVSGLNSAHINGNVTINNHYHPK